ncbi:MAG: alpha/beta hydrolase [Planctomycetota bacterium]
MKSASQSLELVTIDGVTSAECSVIATTGTSSGPPVILVHGILDNLRRWITTAELRQCPFQIPEPPHIIPMYQASDAGKATWWQFPELWEGAGLLQRLCAEGRPAIAYSYQDGFQPVADLDTAVEKLNRVADFAMRRWKSESVTVVAHSRGGLIARHALLRDSAVMTSYQLARNLERLITIATPHLGSEVAKVATPLHRTMQQIGSVLRQSQLVVPNQDWLNLQLLERIELFLTGIGQLVPDSPEVQEVACSKMPPLAGGYFAIAGNVPTLFRIDLPMLRIRVPPSWDIPEWTDGQGDMAVTVPSALDIPHATAGNTRVLPVNHMTATRDRTVHDLIIEWLRRPSTA